MHVRTLLFTSLLVATTSACGSSAEVVVPGLANTVQSLDVIRRGALASNCSPYDFTGMAEEGRAFYCQGQDSNVVVFALNGQLVVACDGLRESACTALVRRMVDTGQQAPTSGN